MHKRLEAKAERDPATKDNVAAIKQKAGEDWWSEFEKWLETV